MIDNRWIDNRVIDDRVIDNCEACCGCSYYMYGRFFCWFAWVILLEFDVDVYMYVLDEWWISLNCFIRSLLVCSADSLLPCAVFFLGGWFDDAE